MFKFTNLVTISDLKIVSDQFEDKIAMINQEMATVEDHLIEEVSEVRKLALITDEDLRHFKIEYNELKTFWNKVAAIIVVILTIFIIATGSLLTHLQSEVNELRNELEATSQASVLNQSTEEETTNES